MIYIKKAAGILMLLSGVCVLALNWIRLLSDMHRRKKGITLSSSPVPFVGPLLICIGYETVGFPFSAHVFLYIRSRYSVDSTVHPVAV